MNPGNGSGYHGPGDKTNHGSLRVRIAIYDKVQLNTITDNIVVSDYCNHVSYVQSLIY